MRLVFALANGLMLVAFLGFTAVQLNDPDPLGWCLVYGGAAGACAVSFLRESWLAPSAAIGAVSLAWAALLAPEAWRLGQFAHIVETMSAGSPGIELWRETLGLLIVAAWMTVLTVRAWRRQRTPARA